MSQPSAAAEIAGVDAPEAVNRAVWQRADVLADYAVLEGWSDPGEWRAAQMLAPQLRNRRILDIGIGSGRTTSWLRLLTSDYVGIDYTHAMVEQARRRHPDADIRDGDARDLSAFADASIDAVTFSFNGIDAVGHADRAQVLREIARVLRPGGIALYSTFNLTGPESKMRPGMTVDTAWTVGNLQPAGPSSGPVRLARNALRFVRDPGRRRREREQYAHLAAQGEQHDGWAIAPCPAYGFSLLVHLVNAEEARAEAARVGLDVELLIASDGALLYEAKTGFTGETDAARWFHVIARRSAHQPSP